jgi:hypothetical protein
MWVKTRSTHRQLWNLGPIMQGFKSFLLVQLAVFTQVSISLEPVLFGPEFTFMADPGHKQQTGLDLHMTKHLIDEQPKGAKFVYDTGYEGRPRWTSPNGWWTAVSYDSGGYEVNVSKMTVSDYKKYAADLQDAIFVSAANVGHFPALWQGGGHINIDTENFHRNPLLFRNFMVDMFNHNELYMGIFNYDLHNAIPFQINPNFAVALREFLSQEIRKEPNFDAVAERFYDFIVKMGAGAVSLGKREESRIEFRAVRPQTSIDMFIRQIELIEARLRYLEKFTEPIPYDPQVELEPTAFDDFAFYNSRPPVDPQEALRAFYNYVTESGQPWRNHRDYMWPQWISGGELEKFENSPWFKSREGVSRDACAKVLKSEHDVNHAGL